MTVSLGMDYPREGITWTWKLEKKNLYFHGQVRLLEESALNSFCSELCGVNHIFILLELELIALRSSDFPLSSCSLPHPKKKSGWCVWIADKTDIYRWTPCSLFPQIASWQSWQHWYSDRNPSSGLGKVLRLRAAPMGACGLPVCLWPEAKFTLSACYNLVYLSPHSGGQKEFQQQIKHPEKRVWQTLGCFRLEVTSTVWVIFTVLWQPLTALTKNVALCLRCGSHEISIGLCLRRKFIRMTSVLQVTEISLVFIRWVYASVLAWP